MVNPDIDGGHEQVIIIAADGVRDMMSNEQCAETAFKYMNPQEIVI